MGKEMVQRTGGTAPVPVHSEDGYAGMPVVIHEVPTWARTKAPESAPLFPKVQAVWSVLVLPFRGLAIGFLWISEYWYRAAGVLISLISLIIIYLTRS